MLSQTAERVYWFSRYLERTENIARLMLVRHQLILDLPTKIQPGWQVLIDMLGLTEIFESSNKSATEKNIIAFLFSDQKNSGSVISSIKSARENIRTTREVLPSETWELVNALYLSVAERSGKELPRSQRHKVLNEVIGACQNISGLLAGTMNHDDAYQFILLGRKLERADMSSRIVDVGSSSLVGAKTEILPYQNVQWISILRSLSAYQMYRLSVRRKVTPESVLNFLIKSTVFPRSIAHNLQEMETCIQKLSNHQQPLSLIQKLLVKLNEVPISEIQRDKLHEFIDELQKATARIHESINQTWLHPEFEYEVS
ncbi:MAG: alpha-E domain-containing protein [Pseudomonadales bacterium]